MLHIATLYMHRCMHIWPCFLSMWGNRPLWRRQYPTLLSLLFDISCDAVTIPCHYKVRYFTSLRHHFLDHQPLVLRWRRTPYLPNPPTVHITLGQWYPCISPSTSSTCAIPVTRSATLTAASLAPLLWTQTTAPPVCCGLLYYLVRIRYRAATTRIGSWARLLCGWSSEELVFDWTPHFLHD